MKTIFHKERLGHPNLKSSENFRIQGLIWFLLIWTDLEGLARITFELSFQFRSKFINYGFDIMGFIGNLGKGEIEKCLFRATGANIVSQTCQHKLIAGCDSLKVKEV